MATRDPDKWRNRLLNDLLVKPPISRDNPATQGILNQGLREKQNIGPIVVKEGEIEKGPLIIKDGPDYRVPYEDAWFKKGEELTYEGNPNVKFLQIRELAKGTPEVVQDVQINPEKVIDPGKDTEPGGTRWVGRGTDVRMPDGSTTVLSEHSGDFKWKNKRRGDQLGVMSRAERRAYEKAEADYEAKRRKEVQERGLGDNPDLMASAGGYISPKQLLQIQRDLESPASLTNKNRKEQAIQEELLENRKQGLPGSDMTIAGLYRDNKAGNVDEVWDLTGPRFIGPMPKSYYDLVNTMRKNLNLRIRGK